MLTLTRLTDSAGVIARSVTTFKSPLPELLQPGITEMKNKHESTLSAAQKQIQPGINWVSRKIKPKQIRVSRPFTSNSFDIINILY